MVRFVLWTLAGLMLGGIVHIAVVLRVPAEATRDIWSRLTPLAELERMVALPRTVAGVPVLPLLDPAMTHGVCRFDLAGGPTRIRARLPDGYWTLSAHDRSGAVRWSVNDRALDGRPLDLMIATPDQVASIRETLPPGLDGLILVEWSDTVGFVLVRVFIGTETATERIGTALAAATCRTDRM